MRLLIGREIVLQTVCSNVGVDKQRKTVLQLQYLQVVIRLHLGICLMSELLYFAAPAECRDRNRRPVRLTVKIASYD